MTVTVIMVYDGKLDGDQFIGINTVLITTVAAMREVFKVNKVRAMMGNGESKNIPDMKA